MHKSLLTFQLRLYSSQNLGVGGDRKITPKIPQIAGEEVSGESKEESHERTLFSPRTQELVGLNTNAQKSSVTSETTVV